MLCGDIRWRYACAMATTRSPLPTHWQRYQGPRAFCSRTSTPAKCTVHRLAGPHVGLCNCSQPLRPPIRQSPFKWGCVCPFSYPMLVLPRASGGQRGNNSRFQSSFREHQPCKGTRCGLMAGLLP